MQFSLQEQQIPCLTVTGVCEKTTRFWLPSPVRIMLCSRGMGISPGGPFANSSSIVKVTFGFCPGNLQILSQNQSALHLIVLHQNDLQVIKFIPASNCTFADIIHFIFH